MIRLKTSENQNPFLPNVPFWFIWKHQKTETLFFPMFPFDPSENIRKPKAFSSQCSLLIPLKTSENQNPFLPNVPFWSVWKYQKTKTLFFPMFPFWSVWKYQKTKALFFPMFPFDSSEGFLFSEGIKREYWEQLL